MTRYYTVWVRSLRYRGHEALTYSSEQQLLPGTVVDIPLQQETVSGFVVDEVAKPAFATKSITTNYSLQLPSELLALANWLRDYYASTIGTIGNLLLPANLTLKKVTQIADIVVADTTTTPKYAVSKDQNNVVKKITKADTYLLHGRTGSGKTRIYIELALQAITANQSALILTPEISLTSQLAQSFQAVFGNRVVVLHSQLTPVQRLNIWLQISRTTEPLLVIGPRSILFIPLRQIGLIVIDEAHEPAYKQEQAPYYQARTVASELARLHHAKLVIGTATPSITDYYLAEQRQKPILRLQSRARADSLSSETAVQIIDLKDRSLFSRSGRLSLPLLTAIEVALSRQQQSLIYLNRRGTARVVLCDNCGWQALCPHCDLPLIYHADANQFRCHTCGYHQSIVTSCPTCGQPEVVFKSFGTKAIFAEIQKLFPNARVQRFDADNNKAERFEQHYEAVKAGEVDILVGTQLLAKGLDLPNLAVLGVLVADSSLSIPDFSARERTFQLLSQALGRVGRGHVAGQAIIQTYHPDSSLLQAAIKDDWDVFYNTELTERQKYHFPPYYHLLKLTCRRASYAAAEVAANKLKAAVVKTISNIEIDGPTPSFHEKAQGKYQCQLIIRSRQRSNLLQTIRLLPPSGWTYDIDPMNLL